MQVFSIFFCTCPISLNTSDIRILSLFPYQGESLHYCYATPVAKGNCSSTTPPSRSLAPLSLLRMQLGKGESRQKKKKYSWRGSGKKETFKEGHCCNKRKGKGGGGGGLLRNAAAAVVAPEMELINSRRGDVRPCNSKR